MHPHHVDGAFPIQPVVRQTALHPTNALRRSLDTFNTTNLLAAWNDGDDSARDRVLQALYNELRHMALRRLRSEREGHTLSPTALANETVLQLCKEHGIQWRDRHHFFAVTAGMMRRILVDYARQRARLKRGGDAVTVHLGGDDVAQADRPLSLIALDDALTALAQVDPRKGRIVELHFFGGLSVQETADALGCSTATVSRDWRMAKAWLMTHLER